MTEQETTADYIGYDLGGYLYNKKYPPNQAAYGTRYGDIRQTIKKHSSTT